jgi:hypothetical protein
VARRGGALLRSSLPKRSKPNWTLGPRSIRRRIVMSCGPRSCSWRARGLATTASPHVWACRAKSSASGVSASITSDCRASTSSRVAGDQPAFPPGVVVAIKALACELPSRRGLPLARWSIAELRQEAVARGLVAKISGTTLGRWLGQDALRPWRHRSWIFPRDPQFARKAGRVIDLYQRRWKGAALGPQTSFITTSPGRPIYVEHEYARAGALAYLAAWDVQRALLFGRCERKNGIAAFEHLIVQIMRRQPYRLARRVFPIADNGSSIVVSQRPTASAPSGPILFWSIRRSTPVGSTRSRSTFLSSSANSLRRATLPTGPTLNGACWPSRRAISGLQGHSSGPLLAVTFTYSSPSSCQAGRPGTNQGRQIRHRNCESQYLVLARLYRKMLGISG